MASPREARQQLKTLEDLSKSGVNIGVEVSEIMAAQKKLTKGNEKAYNDLIKKINETVKIEKDRDFVIRQINKSTLTQIGLTKEEIKQHSELSKRYKTVLDIADKIELSEKRIANATSIRSKLYKTIEAQMQEMSKQSKEMLETAQQMQVHSNLSWRQYTKAYNEAYDAARRMNRETQQQLHQAKDIVDMQNKLMQDGWRDMDMGTMTDVAASMRMVSTTLGIDFPEALSRAFQSSFKQFGDDTDEFIESIGNRLNVFQDKFGIHVGMLTGVVQEMSASTSFLYRNNMQAQVTANESLIKAAALAGRVGLTSSTFISDLAGTAMYGTADEMVGIHQGGALLQGFDTGQFQGLLNTPGGQDQAISNLFGSIYSTMQGLEGNHYLRNQYMQDIGSSFGLSREDMLNIMTHGANLDEYDAELTEQLLNVETSMRDEVRGLRLGLMDKINTWWSNTTMVQEYSKVMQDLGLHGLYGEIKKISVAVTAMAGKDILGGLFKGRATSTGGSGGLGQIGPQLGSEGGMSKGAAIGLGGLGLGVSQSLGGSMQRSENQGANIAGGLTNVLGGVGSGALMGSAFGLPGTVVGAIAGGAIGIANTISGSKERKSAMRDAEDKRRQQSRQNAPTGDPVVDAINRQTTVLEGAIGNSSDATVRATILSDMYKQTTTKVPA